ncbi:hypothetical protein ACU6U9_21550 [Pseudomonas sp. HK3]
MACAGTVKKMTSTAAKCAYVRRTRVGNYLSSCMLEGLTAKKSTDCTTKEDVIAKFRTKKSA